MIIRLEELLLLRHAHLCVGGEIVSQTQRIFYVEIPPGPSVYRVQRSPVDTKPLSDTVTRARPKRSRLFGTTKMQGGRKRLGILALCGLFALVHISSRGGPVGLEEVIYQVPDARMLAATQKKMDEGQIQVRQA